MWVVTCRDHVIGLVTMTLHITCNNGGKILPYSMFEHYSHKDLYFLKLSLYEYYKVVSIVKLKRKQEGDYEFDDTHTQKEMFLQRYSDKKKQLVAIILRGNLSSNEKAKNAIPGGLSWDWCSLGWSSNYASIIFCFMRASFKFILYHRSHNCNI